MCGWGPKTLPNANTHVVDLFVKNHNEHQFTILQCFGSHVLFNVIIYFFPFSCYLMFDNYLATNEQDVWQGTQLLAIDVAAATGLIRRVLIGDELTEKEKKALQRTLTDLASVVPIGVLMLLPVSFDIALFHWLYIILLSTAQFSFSILELLI